MKLAILLFALVAGVYLFFRLRSSGTSGNQPGKQALQAAKETKEKNKFHGVSISYDWETVCDAAKELDGKRYLSNEVPQLPLPGCTAETCKCTYFHHDDRRSKGRGRRLASNIDWRIIADSDEDRRHAPGRRSTDQDK